MKVLIVDEQTEIRESLIRLCEHSDDIQVVGEMSTGRAAQDAAVALMPDLMLLDVELPDISGFELLRSVGEGNHPLGIMVGRCADHAGRAFAEGALDYFVLPVMAERFDQAMVHARHRLGLIRAQSSSSHFHFVAHPPEPGRANTIAPRFLVGEKQRKLYPLDPKSIDYIEADGNYVTLRVGKVEYLSRDSIKRLSMLLSELAFIRIARSLLVNARAVAYAEVAGHGTFALTLTSGACLHSTAAYRECLLRTIPLPALSKRYGATES